MFIHKDLVRNIIISCIIILSGWPLSQLYAAQTLAIQSDHNVYSLDGPFLDVLKDSEGSLSIDDILTPAYQRQFTPLQSETPNFGYTRATYWFRFSLQCPKQCSGEVFLVVGYALLDYISIFSPDEKGQYRETKQGQLIPFEDREIADRNFIFSLKPGKDHPADFYLRVYTEDSFTLPLKIHSSMKLIESTGTEQLFLGLLYGFIVIMVFYNILLFISIKDRAYLYLVCYILSFFIFTTAESGVAYQYFWPDFPWLGKHIIPFSVGLVIIFTSLFVRLFLKTGILTPHINKIITIFFFIGLADLLLAVSIPYFYAIIFAVLAIVFYAPIIISAGFFCMKKGHRQARFFLIAWMALSLGSVLYGLKALGLFPDAFLTRYGVLMGAALQVVFLSLGLADKFNEMNEELSILNRETERKSISLLDMVKRANKISGELTEASNQQAEIADSYTSMAQDQASLSEEMGATYEELTASIESIDKSMKQQVAEGDRSRDMVLTLQEVQKEVESTSTSILHDIRDIISATEATRDNLQELSSMMEIIDEGGHNITTIVSLINDITDRINLLSLNAAIEAARAGEHGRGFAVVADEIGKLAQMTADNSKQISSQVTKISTDIGSGIAVMNEAQDKTSTINQIISNINGQISRVTEALTKQNSSIATVMEQTKEFGSLARLISGSTSEQKVAMSETAETIQRLTLMAQKISENGEVILRITRVLNEKAWELRESIQLTEKE